MAMNAIAVVPAPVEAESPVPEDESLSPAKLTNKVTKEEEKKIVASLRQGTKVTEVAKESGRSYTLVAEIANRYGITRRMKDTPLYDPTLPGKIMELRKSGSRISDIGETLGLSGATISRILHNAGLQGKQGPKASKNGKRRMSAEAIERIAQGQRDRWARAKAIAAKTGENPQLVRTKGYVIPTPQVAPVRGMYPCPECGEKFPLRRILGSHRRMHGVVGTAPSSLWMHKRNQEETTSSEGKERTNGNQPNPESNSEITSHISYLYGKFEANLQDYADRHEIPWKVLASGVAKLFKLRT